MTLNAVLHPARAARLVRFHAEDARNPALSEVTAGVVDVAASSVSEPESHRALRRAVRSVAVGKLIEVAADPATDAAVRAQYEQALSDLSRQLKARPAADVEAADRRSVVAMIERFLNRPAAPFVTPAAPPIPAGPPI